MRGDHAAVPGTPGQRPHDAVRAPCRHGARDLADHLVGHGVVALARVTEASGNGGEDADEIQRVVIGGVEQRPQTLDLRVEDVGELLIGLVGQIAVRQHPGTVDHAGDGAEFVPNLCQHPGQRRPVANVHRHITGPGSRGFKSIEGGPDFPHG